ncbi:MAG: NPCBM/NEW2 domain-containing protein [Streptosporangiaceae bacterium]
MMRGLLAVLMAVGVVGDGEQAAGDGHTITIGGVTYDKGLGTHAPSEVLYYVGKNCSTVTSDVGLDDEKSGAGSATFQVWADSEKRAGSGVVTWQDSPRNLTADVSGAAWLRLVTTDAGDGNTNDHTDWAGARIACRS